MNERGSSMVVALLALIAAWLGSYRLINPLHKMTDAAEAVAPRLTLAGVQPGPNAEAQVFHRITDRGRAPDGPRWTVEGGQEAVASGVDDATAIAANQWEDHGLMPLEVAHRRGVVIAHQPAVASDIGGQNGDEPTLYRGFFVH